MEVLQVLVHFTMYAFLVTSRAPSVTSSLVHAETISGNSRNHEQNHKISQKLLYEITVHGFLLWASVGLLMPLGILAIRLSNRENCRRRLKLLFYGHAIFQTLAVLLCTVGAVMSIRNFSNSFNNHHQRLGLAVYGIVWLQALTGFLRPHRGSKGRGVWFLVHCILGTASTVLGIVNIYTGLIAYHKKTTKSIRLWTITFTVEVSLVAFTYLFQDKWLYIRKQQMTLGHESIRPTDEVISLEKDQKVFRIESC